MNILVTGANGVVGRALLKELSSDDDNVVTCTVRDGDNSTFWYDWASQSANNYCYHETDLTIVKHCYRLIMDVQPDIIYHLAAVSTSSSPPQLVWQNTNMTLNLLEQCRLQELKTKFIQASSMSVEAQPWNVYTASKLACEDLVYIYGKLHNIDVNCIRFPAIVGVGARHGLLKDLIKKVLAEGDTIELFGNRPGSVKPFLFSGHLAKLLVQMADYPNGYHVRVSPTNSISVEEVAHLVMELLDRKKKIVWNESLVWAGDQKYVPPYPSDKVMLTSEEAIVLAVTAILKEEYGK